MAKGELSPERQMELIDQMLRDYGRIDPDDLGAVMGLLALGVVNSAWRNTCVEDWHAEGRLHDGDMLRINSHSTWRVGQRVTGWLTETGLSGDSSSEALERVSFDDAERLAVRLYGWLTNPRRKLPTGQTLKGLAGDQIGEYEECADIALSAVLTSVERDGSVFALKRAAAHGAGACGHWWGHPKWPGLVEVFLTALDDPAHPHWGDEGQLHARLRSEPETVGDRARLRDLLLTKPWLLDADASAWLVHAGLRFAEPR